MVATELPLGGGGAFMEVEGLGEGRLVVPGSPKQKHDLIILVRVGKKNYGFNRPPGCVRMDPKVRTPGSVALGTPRATPYEGRDG